MLKSLAHRPRFGLTLGLHDILSSRKILLLVSGEAKRSILHKLLRSQVTTLLPASFLWLHPNATVLCDEAALGTKSP
jgi:galactosamine-6-phosphate isomerase